MKIRRYRVSRDWYYPHMWAVQTWRVWWPFWSEEIGMLKTREDAEEMVALLEGQG